MAKRSPILGYNHNVLYRGLVFHVQTEDSGVMSPHLFTHLFHHGVIISTRKLVYDAGSGEEAIKSLMQAQHKAVLKDLKRGHFDGKIDEYLGDIDGLLPRSEQSEAASDRSSAPQLARSSTPEIEVQASASELPDLGALGAAFDALTVRDLRDDAGTTQRDDAGATRRDLTPLELSPSEQPASSTSPRTSTRGKLPASPAHANPPSYDDLAVVTSAIATSNATIRTPIQDFASAPVNLADSSPEIEIQLELDESEELLSRNRASHDTDISAYEDPLLAARVSTDRMPSAVPPPTPPERRPSAVGAATLPPARPHARPSTRPAITPPQVVSRPLTSDDPRHRRESDAIEIYAPAPASAEPPPGMGAERPGQYAQHKRAGSNTRAPTDVVRERSGGVSIPPEIHRERSGGVSIPPGLGTPGRVPSPSVPPLSRGIPAIPPAAPIHHAAPIHPPAPITQPVRSAPATTMAMPISRTATPTRTPPTSRTGSSNSGGVVMTRPAVIVGAPAKSAAPPRVRKAREDEGRGFGQGLISEKSLDEVILAYLSEDADDK